MNKQRFFLFLFSVFLFNIASSQDFQITQPQVDFDGRELSINYDFSGAKESDQFYVWVEMEKKNGEPVNMKAISGDVGDKIKAGRNKQIRWIPANDSVFLNEVVSVEVKAEKYRKSYNKSSMMMLSTLFPGLGQTKISKGKPYWLTGVAAYGALAGGFIANSAYIKTYDSYSKEEDPSKRRDLLNQAQSQMNMSSALVVTGAVIWISNLIWVASTPNNYRPLQYVKLSLDQSNGPFKGTTLLTLKVNF